jgi:hypothetical protein
MTTITIIRTAIHTRTTILTHILMITPTVMTMTIMAIRIHTKTRAPKDPYLPE